jgi:hypothetical protein
LIAQKHRGDKKIVLAGLECKDLSNPLQPVELRFIVQNKWWYNPMGKVRAVDKKAPHRHVAMSAMHAVRTAAQQLIWQSQRRGKPLIGALLQPSGLCSRS